MILFLTIAGMSMAFDQHSQDIDMEQIIEEGVSIKLQAFRERKIIDCHEKALGKAVSLVDSTIKVMVYEGKISEKADEVPTKPKKPALRKLNDSLNLRPLFDKDTLNR